MALRTMLFVSLLVFRRSALQIIKHWAFWWEWPVAEQKRYRREHWPVSQELWVFHWLVCLMKILTFWDFCQAYHGRWWGERVSLNLLRVSQETHQLERWEGRDKEQERGWSMSAWLTNFAPNCPTLHLACLVSLEFHPWLRKPKWFEINV